MIILGLVWVALLTLTVGLVWWSLGNLPNEFETFTHHVLEQVYNEYRNEKKARDSMQECLEEMEKALAAHIDQAKSSTVLVVPVDWDKIEELRRTIEKESEK